VLDHLGKPDGHIEQLTRGFRVPASVISYAARLLPYVAPDLAPPVAVRRTRGELTFTTGSLASAVASVVPRDGSVGLIVPDVALPAVRTALAESAVPYAEVGLPVSHDSADGSEDGADESEFDAHLDLVPASLAKGLEFDHVVVDDPAGIVAGESDRATGLRRLYVCLTRAVTSLVVRHGDDLPVELGDQPTS
jgi:hypothetical protein